MLPYDRPLEEYPPLPNLLLPDEPNVEPDDEPPNPDDEPNGEPDVELRPKELDDEPRPDELDDEPRPDELPLNGEVPPDVEPRP